MVIDNVESQRRKKQFLLSKIIAKCRPKFGLFSYDCPVRVSPFAQQASSNTAYHRRILASSQCLSPNISLYHSSPCSGDYCDRSFNDIPSARKKHFESKYHKMMVKLHYDSYKDPAELLAEEARKPPCRNLQITGKCEFGPNCRFSHVFQHFPGISLASLSEPDSIQALKSQLGLRIPSDNLPPSMVRAPPGGYRIGEAELGTWG